MTEHIQTDDDLFEVNDSDHFDTGEDDDDFFDPDYVEAFEPKPRRPRYDKAAPRLALSSRLAALKYSRHIALFRKKFAALCTTTIKPDRAHDRLLCARMGDEYFVFKVHCAKYVAPPIPIEFFGVVQNYASPSRLVATAELVYADDTKRLQKYEDLRRLAYTCPSMPIMVFGEKFYCGELSLSFSSFGCKTDIELIYPFEHNHKVYDTLRDAEKRRKKEFAKYTSAEQQVTRRRSIIEFTRQMVVYLDKIAKAKDAHIS